jgi:hypothetical protein
MYYVYLRGRYLAESRTRLRRIVGADAGRAMSLERTRRSEEKRESIGRQSTQAGVETG